MRNKGKNNDLNKLLTEFQKINGELKLLKEDLKDITKRAQKLITKLKT